MRKREIGDENEIDVKNTSRYPKSGIQLAWLGWEDSILVLLVTGSGFEHAISGIVYWPRHEIRLSPSFLWWFSPSLPISRFLVLNSTIP
jgi:hypothetical protein